MFASSSCEQRIASTVIWWQWRVSSIDKITFLKKTVLFAQIHYLKVETANPSTSRSSPQQLVLLPVFLLRTRTFILYAFAYKTPDFKISLIQRINFFLLPLDVFRSIYSVLLAYLLRSLFKCTIYSTPNWRMNVDDKLLRLRQEPIVTDFKALETNSQNQTRDLPNTK